MSGAKVVVIGAGGLVGTRFTEKLLRQQTLHLAPDTELPVKSVILFDQRKEDIFQGMAKEVLSDKRVEVASGDMCDRGTIDKLVAPNGCARVAVVQLAALLSGNAEDNFDLGMKVNLQGSIGVMEALRAVSAQLAAPPIYIFCSTDFVACYNERNRSVPVNEEAFRLSPVSYGIQKACVELLVCDYSRKGFIDGRVARLSCVLGRPGRNNVLSWYYGGVFTETLAGRDVTIPKVLEWDRPYPCSSVDADAVAILHLCGKVGAEQLGHNRVVQLPCKSFTIREIWATAQRVGARLGLRMGSLTVDKEAESSVKALNVCPRVSCEKAASLGIPVDTDIETIITDYAHRFVLPRGAAAKL